jgi:hypothetical protein
LPSILKQPGYPVVPTAAAILLAAQLFCQAAKMAATRHHIAFLTIALVCGVMPPSTFRSL